MKTENIKNKRLYILSFLMIVLCFAFLGMNAFFENNMFTLAKKESLTVENASLTVDGVTTYYADFESAFNAANSASSNSILMLFANDTTSKQYTYTNSNSVTIAGSYSVNCDILHNSQSVININGSSIKTYTAGENYNPVLNLQNGSIISVNLNGNGSAMAAISGTIGTVTASGENTKVHLGDSISITNDIVLKNKAKLYVETVLTNEINVKAYTPSDYSIGSENPMVIFSNNTYSCKDNVVFEAMTNYAPYYDDENCRVFTLKQQIYVSFDANGICANPSNKTVAYNSAYGALPTISASGYVFDGWWTALEGGSNITDATIVTEIDDHTLYAHWTDITVAIVTSANHSERFDTFEKAFLAANTLNQNASIYIIKEDLTEKTLTFTNDIAVTLYGEDISNITIINNSNGTMNVDGVKFKAYKTESKTANLNFQAGEIETVELRANGSSFAAISGKVTNIIAEGINTKLYFGNTIQVEEKILLVSSAKIVVERLLENEFFVELDDPSQYLLSENNPVVKFTNNSFASNDKFSFSENSDYETVIDEDLQEIYTKRTAVVVNLDANGKTLTNTPTTVIYEKIGNGFYLDENCETKLDQTTTNVVIPAADGYTFLGYYTAKVNGVKYINAEGYLTSFADNEYFTAEGSLYAIWEANEIVLPQVEQFVAVFRTLGEWTFEAAQNGTGNYTYSITSQGNLNGISLAQNELKFEGMPTSNVGVYTIKVRATDNETQKYVEQDYSFLVEQKKFTSEMIQFDQEEIMYNAIEQKAPTVTVVDGNYTANDWELSGETTRKTNVGNYEVTITATGFGNYKGSATKAWKIIEYTGVLTITPIVDTFEYDSTEKQLEVSISINGNVIQNGDVNIINNKYTNSSASVVGGKYTAIITGQNNISSTVIQNYEWTISPKQIDVVWDNYVDPEYNGGQHDIPTGSANSGIEGQQIVLDITEENTHSKKVSEIGQYVAVATIASVQNGEKTNYVLNPQTARKNFNVLKVGQPISKLNDAEIMVGQSVDIKDCINISNVVNPNVVTYIIKEKTNSSISASISSSTLFVTALPQNDDNDQFVTVTASVAQTEDYIACDIDILVRVKKYDVDLVWTSTINSIDFGDSNRVVSAKATSLGGSVGGIQYSSTNTNVLSIDSVIGEMTTHKAGSTILKAKCASTTTVKGKTIELPFAVNKQKVKEPTLSTDANYVYTGSQITAQFDNFNFSLSTVYDNVGIDAGVYNARFVLNNKNDYQWQTAGDEDCYVRWTIQKRLITRPTMVTSSYEYIGTEIELQLANLQDKVINNTEIYTIVDNVKKDSGSYKAKIALDDINNNKWATGDENSQIAFDWFITPKALNISSWTVQFNRKSNIYKNLHYETGVGNEFVQVEYTLGENKSGTFRYENFDFTVRLLDGAGPNEQTYLQKNYSILSVGDLILDAGVINIPVKSNETIVYDGSPKTFNFENFDDFGDGNTAEIIIKQNGTVVAFGKDAGTYTVSVILNNNYKWSDGSLGEKIYDFEILKAKVEKEPYLRETSFRYRPEGHRVDVMDVATEFMRVSGDVEKVAVGNYTVLIEIIDSNHCFGENGSSRLTMQLDWQIQKGLIKKPSISKTSHSYTKQLISIIDYFENYTEQDKEFITIDNVDINYTYQAIEVGQYRCKFIIKEKANYLWQTDDGSIDNNDLILNWEITKADVKIPNTLNILKKYTFTNKDITLEFESYNTELINITGNVAKYANAENETYKAVISLKDTANYKWLDNDTSEPQTVEWQIIKASILTPVVDGEYTYNADEQTIQFVQEIDENLIEIIDGKQTNAGIYTVELRLKDTENCMWKETSSTEPIFVEWIIKKAIIEKPQLLETEFVYNSEQQSVELSETGYFVVDEQNSVTAAINVGSYSVIVLIDEDLDNNYMFADESNSATLYWTISKKSVKIPTLEKTSYVYSGETYAAELKGFDERVMRIVGESSGSAVKVYRFIIELTDTQNYKWEDGTTKEINYSWSIVNSNTLLIIALSAGGAVAIATGVGFTVFTIRKRKKTKLKLTQADDEE